MNQTVWPLACRRPHRPRTRLHFTFNGQRYEGYAGDTLASALLANGVHVVARSWKYHRPRGIVARGVEEPNAVVQLETGAAHRAQRARDRGELYEGLAATSVNGWPSVEFDLMAVAGLFARADAAGFYYKTFMWPQSLLDDVRALHPQGRGPGPAPTEPDPDRYDRMNAALRRAGRRRRPRGPRRGAGPPAARVRA